MFRVVDGNVTGPSESVNRRTLLLCLLVWALLRALLVAGVDLSKDETAYWYWSRQLDASYAWLPFAAIALADALRPGADLLLRLPFVAMGTISALLLHHLCRLRSLSPTRSVVAVAAFATSHWIWHTSSFLHPDGFLVPAWLAVLVCSERASRGDGDGWWWAVGAAAGLAALTKYSGLVLSAGLFGWFLFLAVRGQRRPLLRAGIPFACLSLPILYDLLATGFALPASLSTLSAVAPESLPLRLALFVVAPLLYISPFLLFALYRGAWTVREQWRRAPHLWAPGMALAICFCFFALTRGQVKGNWILPGFLGLWPLAFSARCLHSRRFAVLLLATGVVGAAIPAVTLRWPAVADGLSRTVLRPLNDSYTAIVSRPDLPREPTYSWTERVCEYHGWPGFGRRLDDVIRDQGLEGPVTIASPEYGLAFGAARYARRVQSVALPGDPRFARLTMAPAQAALHLKREGLHRPPAGPLVAVIERYSPGCQPLRYEVYEPPPASPGAGASASAGRERADASRR